jgi:hypothetical protein
MARPKSGSALADKLGHQSAPELSDRRRRLNERLRAELMAGAETEWLKRTGRLMTAEELDRVLRRCPGTCEPVPI